MSKHKETQSKLGGEDMRTLAEIRLGSKSNGLLFTGVEQKPIQFSPEEIEEARKETKGFRDIAKDVLHRYLDKTTN